MTHYLLSFTDALAIGTCVAALDFVWARYNIACAQHRAMAAGVYSVGIYLLAGLATVQFVSDPWLLIPGCAGAFVGTTLSIKTKRGSDGHAG